MKLSQDKEEKTRKTFIYWIMGTFSAMMLGKFFTTGEKMIKATEKKEKPVKMLTEDGRLVEVDAKFLTGTRRHIQPDDIHNWVKRKND